MGTNYYLKTQGEEPHCSTCDCRGRGRHIGKSSGGWCFALRVYPDEGIRFLDDWIRLFEKRDVLILDEYNQRVSVFEMLETILNRPASSQRHEINGVCIQHGRGPYDYMEGEFY
jgi:hypothetical protein